MKRLFMFLPALVFATQASASTAYGSLSNFDVVNDTGQVCHGFEIELEDIRSTDITYTYDYNHYGTPKIRQDNTDPAHPKVFVRYESARDASGNYLAFTAVPVVPVTPTNGHQCTNPGVNLGCEHFGVGNYGSPSVIRYNWLIDDGAGNLIRGPAVNVPAPTWVYYPPVPILQPVAQVQAVIVAPPEPPEVVVKEFGEAIWVKAIKTTSHNNHEPELRDLVSDDPDDPDDVNWANGEPDEVEIEFHIMQKEFSKPGEGNDELAGGNEDLPNGDEVVTRRYEFFKYSGPYDEETNEILCDTYPDPAPAPECDVELLGDYIGAQMAGFNVESVLGLVDHLQEGVEGEAYPDRTVVIGGNSPYDTTITGPFPAGLAIDPLTGVLSGTPGEFGTFAFSIRATDADGLSVSNDYVMTIASGDTIPPVTTSAVAPAPNGAGWNNVDATVFLNAADEAGGSGVQSITTSATGSQAEPAAVTPGALASVTITIEGISTVSFHATDNAGNAEASQDVVVMLDKTAPQITPPAEQNANQTSLAGAFVHYPAPVIVETGSGLFSSGCLPATGSLFPIGPTTVTCTAVDIAGNSATAGFIVTVLVVSPAACDADGDFDIDGADLLLIRVANGHAAAPGDPRDGNRDGRINVGDIRYCQLRQTAGTS